MSVKISDIVSLDPDASNPVMLLNMHKYWWQLFGAKGFRARNYTYPATDGDGSNVVFVAGKEQLYRGYIGGIDVKAGTPQPAKRPADEPLRTYVAKRNRVTGQMRLVEVISTQLAHVSHDSGHENQVVSDPTDRATSRKLVQKFSSKDSLSHVNRLQRQKCDVGIMEHKLQQTIADYALKGDGDAGISSDPIQAEQDEVDVSKPEFELCSKANGGAKRLCDLYSAESLIGETLLNKLTEPAKTLLQTPPEELQMCNVYLTNRVKALMQAEDVASEESVNIARICLFMDGLVLLRSMSYSKSKNVRNYQLSRFTDALDEPLRQNFLQYRLNDDKESLSVTRYTRDKSLLYYMALLFTIEGREAVSVDLEHHKMMIPKTDFIKYARAIGVRYDKFLDSFSIGSIKQAMSQLHKKKLGRRS